MSVCCLFVFREFTSSECSDHLYIVSCRKALNICSVITLQRPHYFRNKRLILKDLIHSERIEKLVHAGSWEDLSEVKILRL